MLAAAVSDMAVHGRAGDLEAYIVADVRFHATLLAASGNEMIRALADVVAEVLAGRTHHDLMPARPNPDAIALHDAVARAVREGDARAAEDAMRGIIDEAAQALGGRRAEVAGGGGFPSSPGNRRCSRAAVPVEWQAPGPAGRRTTRSAS